MKTIARKPYQPKPTTITYLTLGDCWVLAGALHRMTGWQIVATVPDYLPRSEVIPPGRNGSDWTHMAVRTPDRKVLDILGPQRLKPFLSKWSESEPVRLVKVSPEDWKYEASAWGSPIYYRNSADVSRIATRLLDTHYPLR